MDGYDPWAAVRSRFMVSRQQYQRIVEIKRKKKKSQDPFERFIQDKIRHTRLDGVVLIHPDDVEMAERILGTMEEWTTDDYKEICTKVYVTNFDSERYEKASRKHHSGFGYFKLISKENRLYVLYLWDPEHSMVNLKKIMPSIRKIEENDLIYTRHGNVCGYRNIHLYEI